ncbi:maltodextrose utilization protein malA [Ligilactobacillus salitolerans]|uniref:Maltodextrose utilization protein malA n=1 Tax=Ligilactobacillus salitolerans TaxID=1808352 RepID=A0A401IRE6_9LACO|nr:DUF1189 family protein [Ligilactobacillus salitolerans]GBG94087.1 maltodextrose utilization protein malA [Ligilactobacillus salitolerans]
MIKESFPLNYFASWFSPVKMFRGRKSLGWLQIIIVLLFLMALNLLPVPAYFQRQKSVPLDIYLPQVQKLLQKNDKGLEQAVQKAEFTAERFKFEQSQIVSKSKTSIVGIGLSAKKIGNFKNAVVLNNDHFIFKEDGQADKVYYSDHFNPQTGIKQQLEHEWYQRNKGTITFMMLQSIGSLFLLTNLIFVFGGAFLLWLGRKSPLVTKSSFKENVNLMVNILGPVSLLTAIIGFLKFDLSLMLMLQMLGAVIIMLTVYAKTKFNDHASV